MRKAWQALVGLLLLWGCASSKFERAEIAKRAQTEMIGMSKKQLLMCAGVPVRSQTAEGIEFLTYTSGGDSVGYATGGAGSSGGASVVAVQRRYCEVTFALEDGAIKKVTYAGRTGGLITEGEQCAFVVRNCVSAK